MVKLSVDVVADCPQYTNPLRDREIDMRGCKLSVIENLGVTLVSRFVYSVKLYATFIRLSAGFYKNLICLL